jgi:hypothetical protein
MSALPESANHNLLPHPDSPASPVRAITIRAALAGGRLMLQYRLEGDLDALRLPVPAEPRHTDGLWRHTCFEVFVRLPAGSGYQEYNFSPSGAWAAYQFSGYRADMRALGMQTAPDFSISRQRDLLEVNASVDLRTPGGAVGIRLGVTAVIEGRSGLLSYWALKHPPGKPDFHHADGFVLDVS